MKTTIFVGSSNERRVAAEALVDLLSQRLDDAEVRFWPDLFLPSKTNIESIERAAADADFAVLVMTPDDSLRIRRRKALAPRDNITFETGFFMGHLGRDRCYIVQERRRGLRVPTDLLGVTVASFASPGRKKIDWHAALARSVERIAAAIGARDRRIRLDPASLLKLTQVYEFARLVEGCWWERIRGNKRMSDWLTFFRLEPNASQGTIRIEPGPGYTARGMLGSRWTSNRLIARVDEDAHTVHYHWAGYYVRRPKKTYHGEGEMTYEGQADTAAPFTKGHGWFWDVDEKSPAKTIERSTEVRRMTPHEYGTMQEGTQMERRRLVVKVLKEWR